MEQQEFERLTTEAISEIIEEAQERVFETIHTPNAPIITSTVESDISPEHQELLDEFRRFIDESSPVEEEEEVQEEVEEQTPVPPTPLGYDNSQLSYGYMPEGTPEVLEVFVKRVELGTWYITSMMDRGGSRGSTAPESGACRIALGESNAGTTELTQIFWVNNYWTNRFTEADRIGRPKAMLNHIEIPTNSNSLAVDVTTTRFSGAIWYEKLQTKEIILAGVGGIGSYIGFLLARMKPQRLIIYDGDTVEAVNMSGQLYCRENIGYPKVDALAEMVANYADYHNVLALESLYQEDSRTKDIMICGFDNMAARSLFFHKWLDHVTAKPKEERGKCLFIDGRLAAEEFQVLAIQGDDERAIREYSSKWLFSDAIADATICSYKQTTFMANMIASVMVNIFVNFVANECNPVIPRDVPFYTSYAADTMYFKVEM